MTNCTCQKLIIEDGFDNECIIPPVIEKLIGQTQNFLVEITTRSSPNKIAFVIVDIVKTPTPNIIPQRQSTLTPVFITDVEKQTTTEITTAETSSVTPPPRISEHTPPDKKELIHKDTETLNKADYGPKKRLSFEYKGNEREEGKKKKQ
ncbi:hypothetical protein L1887_13867 [Cichorium endivia]|nr:hypothetical protein L1887_13867 [Cichorium endivia]